MVVPILSPFLPFILYHSSVFSITFETFSSGINTAASFASRGCLPCLPPTLTKCPYLSAFHDSVGHALMQSPQYMHFAGSYMGLPVSGCETIAPSLQALEHIVHPVHVSSSHAGSTTP